MKIGIVTLVSDNYGNKYQNYAVEQMLSEYGDVVTYRVESRNQSNPKQRESIFRKLNPKRISESISARLMNYYDINNARRSALGNLAYFLRHKKQIVGARALRHRKFLAYQQDCLHISERVITGENCREEPWNRSHDYFVCGSDQIWNPNYATTSELAFLSFAPDRSVALAPSFGVSQVAEEKREQLAGWISGVRHLSVREEAGSKIIKELTGRDAPVLLDPTMAINAEKWRSLAKKPEVNFPERYVLTYFLGRMTDTYHNRIRKIAADTGLPVIQLFNIEDPNYYSLDPNEVLYAISHADIVLTDSFHGSVFSVLFQRDFLVFRRDEGGESMHSRLATLLQKFGLTDRLDNGANEVRHIPAEKWMQVGEILETERNRTRAYLKNALHKE